MTKTISRQKIWSNHFDLGKMVSIIQDIKYNPANYPFKAGETIITPEDKKLTLTQKQAEELNNEEYAAYLSDKDDFEAVEDLNLGEIKISALLKPQGNTENISEKLKSFIEEHRIPHVIIVNDWPVPYILPDVQEAAKSNNIFLKWANEDFIGGFKVQSDDVQDLLRASLDLIKKVKDYPDILWYFPETKYLFSFCEYGILHIEGYDDLAANFIDHLKSHSFTEVNSCKENSIYD